MRRDAMKTTTGKVYLVGAGPGAPDLITLRGAEILGRADIVFHDALVHQDVLAMAPRAEKLAVAAAFNSRVFAPLTKSTST